MESLAKRWNLTQQKRENFVKSAKRKKRLKKAQVHTGTKEAKIAWQS